MPIEVSLIVDGIKIASFVNLSTITTSALNLFDSGSGPIMSTDMISHGFDGTSLGTRGAYGLFRFNLVH